MTIKKHIAVTLILFAYITLIGLKAFADSDYNTHVAKMKQICINYSKYRLSLDQDTYMATRDSDYNKLEHKLYNLGATEVNERANCHAVQNRCVWIKFRYKNNSYNTKYCK